MADNRSGFEERLQREYDLPGRLRTAIKLSGLLYVCFLALDAIYAPQVFPTFLAVRLTVAALHVVLYYLASRPQSDRGYIRLAMALVIFDAAGIAFMIQVLGGFMTSYYQGLNLIVMGMIVVIPLSFRDTVILYALIWMSYVVPSAAGLLGRSAPFVVNGIEVAQWRFVANNLFFMTSLIVIGASGSYIMDTIRRRELRGRIELEDITRQLQESNAKLKTLDELKTQFFANVNHELRTPLTLMLAPLGPLLEGRMGKLLPPQKETVETIRRNGFKLLRLINNLLDLTKFEEGKMRLKVKPVEFTEFVTALLSSVQPLADQREIKLYFQHPPHRFEVTVDADQYEKVVLNLLSNALKFTPRRGRITVYLEDQPDLAHLVVEDTGIGVPKDCLESIFDRFSQVDGSASRRHEGTGIGLSLAREIVLLHGGRIWAESELGKGSRFHVDVLKGEDHFTAEVLDRRVEDQPVALRRRSTDEAPRVQDIVADFRRLQLVDLEQVEVLPEAERPRSRDFSLLVIDDNPEVLKLMRVLLEDEFDMDFATTAERGLELMREKSPDLVLCDVMMPGMDGHTLCRLVKADEDLKHVPVILVTARSGADMVAEGIDSGADDYIAKPFDSVELRARIRSLLRIRRVESQLALANRNLKMRTNDLVDQQKSLFLSMVKSLVSAIDAKDEYTRHHSTRVTEFTLQIARKMGFSEHELEDLELASLLHDVGKIAVPESILNKPSKLSDDEFAFIKEHTVKGEAILRPVVELQQISKIVRAHHEHYDGTGYPDGLKGLEIPIGARIMGVADAYDSITSERPYRKAASHNFAVKEITRCSGGQFDPEVVQNFLEIAAHMARVKTTSPAPRSVS